MISSSAKSKILSLVKIRKFVNVEKKVERRNRQGEKAK